MKKALLSLLIIGSGCESAPESVVRDMNDYDWSSPRQVHVRTARTHTPLQPAPSAQAATGLDIRDGANVLLHGCEVIDAHGVTWCRVEVGGSRGWVNEADLEQGRASEGERARALAPPVQAEPARSADASALGRVESPEGYANLRSRPTIAAAVIARVESGETLMVHGCGPHAGDSRVWCRVSYGDMDGWMTEAYLSVSEDLPAPARR